MRCKITKKFGISYRKMKNMAENDVLLFISVEIRLSDCVLWIIFSTFANQLPHSMKILTGTQHKELDLYTIENEPIDSIDLMERASRAIAAEIMRRWDKQRTVFVFAGAGNNGGDGLAVARLLFHQGYRVAVFLFNIKGKLSVDCEINRDRLLEILEEETAHERLVLKEITQGFDFPKVHQQDIVVDALFGTGMRGPLSGGFAVVVRKINSLHAHVVSIDVPSGLMCEDNSFTDRNTVIHAELTLTMQLPKLAFLMADNETCVGEWKTLDIRLSPEGMTKANTPYTLIERQDVRDMLRTRSVFAHKGNLGHALLVAGCYGMAGAAILSCQGCLRSGTGKLTLHTGAANNTIIQISVPEVVMWPDRNNRCISDTPDISPYATIGLGPGIGKDPATVHAVHEYLALADMPMVVDADALNILGEHREWMGHLPSGSILTPHVKELERMTGSCTSSYERLMRATELALQYHVYVILKGHYTAICTPQGRVFFCPRGNAGMATPGSGDVLTGILTGLLAQGYAPSEAAILGVWLHASAGDLAAHDLSEESMLASDIVTHLGKAFQELRTSNYEL